jgi:hypothetical protein
LVFRSRKELKLAKAEGTKCHPKKSKKIQLFLFSFFLFFPHLNVQKKNVKKVTKGKEKMKIKR